MDETINHLLVGCVSLGKFGPWFATVRAAAVGTTACCDSFLGVVEEVNCCYPQGSA
jgi:hypothetical protein